MKKFFAVILTVAMILAMMNVVFAAESDEPTVALEGRVGTDKTVAVDVNLVIPAGHSGIRGGKMVLSYTMTPGENVSYKGNTPGAYFDNTDTSSFMCNDYTSSEKLVFGMAFSDAVTTSGTIATFNFTYAQAGTITFTLKVDELIGGEDATTLLNPTVSAPITLELTDIIPETSAPVTTAPVTTQPVKTTEPPTSSDPVTTKPAPTTPAPTPPDGDYFTVIFVDWNGEELARVYVKPGQAADAPDDPVRVNWVFKGWDTDFSNVNADMTVTALYNKLGDGNGDNDVNAGDATLALRHAVGNSSLNEQQKKYLDVNQNGSVEAGDATLILRHTVGSKVIDFGE